MKIILDNFKYRGMKFNHYEIDAPQIGDVYEPMMAGDITELIKETLDHEIFEETCKRG